MKRDKEDAATANPYQNLDKTTVLQDAKYFNISPVNPRKCSLILSKILYLLNQGENLTTQEATDAFFATTKLFQSNDVMLRRLVYLCIKELSSLAQDVIIVTSSLTKDMTGKENLYRAAAIRALYSITDNTMLQAIERYMKQAIVDKTPAVSSAALVSALHLSPTAPELVKRWANEALEVIGSDNQMVSYHALAVVANTRKNDRLSTMKLVQRLTTDQRQRIESPYTLCLLIRLAAQLADREDPDNAQQYMAFIKRCLHHKSEMIVYEAAHAMINLGTTNAQELASVVAVLKLFCASSKAAMRLAGARTLALLTSKYPSAVSAFAVDLEMLISDPNRAVATLAVTTLLSNANENSVDRLMKQISTFMSDISDEFKIIVVNAIRRLCKKYPGKHKTLSAFLAGMLRDEGGVDYKAAIADAIISLVEENPEAKESGLAHLCEFIEDCEHTNLAVRILHLLGREGPKSRHPSRYIRFIYNRIILESGAVRAAAVSAVAQFGAQRPELLPNIKVLLSRCQMDDEDEVRDRAVYYNAILESGDQKLINDCIVNVRNPNLVLLEQSLRNHLATTPNEPFDINAVPLQEDIQDKENDAIAEVEVRKTVQRPLEEIYAEELSKIPGVDRLGPLFKTSPPIELTEPETEYVVRLLKHVYSRHVILQFECINTLSDQILEDVHVDVVVPEEYDIRHATTCRQLVYDKPQSVYVILEYPSAFLDSMGPFAATLEFTVKDCDPTTGVADPGDGYADSYSLEDFDMGCSDQIRARGASEDWEQNWERSANVPHASDTFVLPQRDINDAAHVVCEHLGLPSSAISGETVKEIRGVGMFRGGAPVLVNAKLAATSSGITMKLEARSPREDVAMVLLAAIG